jgi:hypothetical protein
LAAVLTVLDSAFRFSPRRAVHYDQVLLFGCEVGASSYTDDGSISGADSGPLKFHRFVA